MPNEIISYVEMCRREGVSLQRGMNFGLGGNHSVILMSVRRGAPYRDRLEEDGSVLVYEWHDESRNRANPNPKQVDQPEQTPWGLRHKTASLFAPLTTTSAESDHQNEFVFTKS